MSTSVPDTPTEALTELMLEVFRLNGRLLNSGERQFCESARALTERLGGLPLALELSKSYLNYRKDLSIPALLEEMKKLSYNNDAV